MNSFSSILFPFCGFPQRSFNRVIAPNAGVGVPVWRFQTGVLKSIVLFRHYINLIGNSNTPKCSGTWNQIFGVAATTGVISDLGISGFDALIKSGSGPNIDYDIAVDGTITVQALNPTLENLRIQMTTVIEQIFAPPAVI